MLELEEFKESLEEVLGEQWEDEKELEQRGIVGLGSVRDAVEVREEREEVEREVQEAVRQVKVLYTTEKNYSSESGWLYLLGAS